MREALRTNLQVKRAEWGGHREDGRIKVMAGMMDGDRKPPDVGCGGGGGGGGARRGTEWACDCDGSVKQEERRRQQQAR